MMMMIIMIIILARSGNKSRLVGAKEGLKDFDEISLFQLVGSCSKILRHTVAGTSGIVGQDFVCLRWERSPPRLSAGPV
jgi:hypothetical protein